MSVLVDGSVSSASELLHASTPAAASNVTVMWWMFFDTDLNNFTSFLWFGRNSASGPFQAIYIGTGADGTNFEIWQDGARRDTGTLALVVSRWYHISMITQLSPSAAFTCYLYDLTANSTTTRTGTWSATSPSHVADRTWFGNDPFVEVADAWFANIKIWNTIQLTQAQIEEERWIVRAKNRRDLLWQEAPIYNTAALNDWSGNGRNYTTAGTVSSQNHAPATWIRQRARYVMHPAAAGRTTRNTLVSPLGQYLGRGLWTHGGTG